MSTSQPAAASEKPRLADTVRDTVFSPIGGEGLVQQTVRRLGEAIGLGLLRVGERLPPETELAARFEISPMTLRQALAILRETGYIETSRGKGGGTFVKLAKPFRLAQDQPKVTAEELVDLTDYRVAISGRAAALAAERASDEDIEQLESLVEAMSGKVTFARFRQLDGQFHLAVAAAARSRRLTEAEASIRRSLVVPLSLAGDDPTKLSLESSNDQHVAIVEAIRARDIDAARTEMEAHVRGTLDILVGLRLGMLDE